MFASTHEGEEKKFVKIIKKLLKKYKNLKIIIAPRHPKRTDSIINMLNKENINSSLINNSLNLDEDVFLINVFGKMTLYYSFKRYSYIRRIFYKNGRS